MKLNLNIRLDEDIVQRLKELKTKTGASVTFQIELALRQYLKEKEVQNG